MMFCKKCGAEIADDCTFCPKCGEVLSAPEKQSEWNAPSTPNVKKKKGVLLGCGIVLAIIFIILMVIIVFVAMLSAKGNSQSSLTAGVTSTGSIIAQSSISDVITGISPEQESAVLSVLDSCNIQINTIKRDDGLDHDGMIGYRISNGNINNIILYLLDDFTVTNVRYADNDLYKEGKLLFTLTDVLNRPELELLGETDGTTNDFGITITGKIKNNTSKQYSYVQATFNLYNDAGELIGTALANVTHLGAQETWAFSAIGVCGNVATYKLNEISGS